MLPLASLTREVPAVCSMSRSNNYIDNLDANGDSQTSYYPPHEANNARTHGALDAARAMWRGNDLSDRFFRPLISDCSRKKDESCSHDIEYWKSLSNATCIGEAEGYYSGLDRNPIDSTALKYPAVYGAPYMGGGITREEFLGVLSARSHYMHYPMSHVPNYQSSSTFHNDYYRRMCSPGLLHPYYNHMMASASVHAHLQAPTSALNPNYGNILTQAAAHIEALTASPKKEGASVEDSLCDGSISRSRFSPRNQQEAIAIKLPTEITLAAAKKKQVRHKIHYCKIEGCGYKSDRVSNLKNHSRSHTGEKPFTCSMCSYASSQDSNLRAHIRRHEKMSNNNKHEGSIGDTNDVKISANLPESSYTCSSDTSV